MKGQVSSDGGRFERQYSERSFLRATNPPATTKEIAEEVGCHPSTARTRLKNLKERGLIRDLDTRPMKWERSYKQQRLTSLNGFVDQKEIEPNGLGVKTVKHATFRGEIEERVQQVGDGSIIKMFDKSPDIPRKPTDVVCPHFLELKWGNGCHFDCAWCYLNGTFRFLDRGKNPHMKGYTKIQKHLEKFFEKAPRRPEVLNTGELSDSLMWENKEQPFSKFILQNFKNQSKGHRVLFLTKSPNIDNLLDPEFENPEYAIVSFSLNAPEVAKRWERAPPIEKRIEAATKVYNFGYETRIRIDPMVPIEGWRKAYKNLIDDILTNLTPERITLGSLRGLISTINNCEDTTWTKYLNETSGWGKKIDHNTRLQMYTTTINHLTDQWNYPQEKIGFCKETTELWEDIGMNWKNITCNCIR